MPLTIYKYPLEQSTTTLSLPVGAKVLDVQLQDRRLHLWACVDLAGAHVDRRFLVFGTGHGVPDGLQYIATVQDGPYVWHVFEEVPLKCF